MRPGRIDDRFGPGTAKWVQNPRKAAGISGQRQIVATSIGAPAQRPSYSDCRVVLLCSVSSLVIAAAIGGLAATLRLLAPFARPRQPCAMAGYLWAIDYPPACASTPMIRYPPPADRPTVRSARSCPQLHATAREQDIIIPPLPGQLPPPALEWPWPAVQSTQVRCSTALPPDVLSRQRLASIKPRAGRRRMAPMTPTTRPLSPRQCSSARALISHGVPSQKPTASTPPAASHRQTCSRHSRRRASALPRTSAAQQKAQPFRTTSSRPRCRRH